VVRSTGGLVASSRRCGPDNGRFLRGGPRSPGSDGWRIPPWSAGPGASLERSSTTEQSSPAVKARNHEGWRIASMSISILTVLPMKNPPPSRGALNVMPKSSRSISVVAVSAIRC